MKVIGAAANTVVPAVLVLERLGFAITVEITGVGQQCRASRGDESYIADDPITVLGLVKLVEARGWSWGASDVDIERVLRAYNLA